MELQEGTIKYLQEYVARKIQERGFAVGIKLGLDIEKEFIEKEKIVDQRIYKRAVKEQ